MQPFQTIIVLILTCVACECHSVTRLNPLSATAVLLTMLIVMVMLCFVAICLNIYQNYRENHKALMTYLLSSVTKYWVLLNEICNF